MISWKYGTQRREAPRNDEEVISVNVNEIQGGYVLIYLYSPDFEEHLGRFETIRTAEYRLFEEDTNSNFISSQLGGYHEGMFAINPEELRSKQEEPDDEGNLPPPPVKLTSMVGCFILYKNKDYVVVDHLSSACFERVSEKELLKHVVENLKTTNTAGDLKGLQAFWSNKIDQKKAQEGKKKEKTSEIKLVTNNLP